MNLRISMRCKLPHHVLCFPHSHKRTDDIWVEWWGGGWLENYCILCNVIVSWNICRYKFDKICSLSWKYAVIYSARKPGSLKFGCFTIQMSQTDREPNFRGRLIAWIENFDFIIEGILYKKKEKLIKTNNIYIQYDDVSPLQPKALLTSELYWHLGEYFQFNRILIKHNYHQENDPHHHQDSDHQDDVVDQPGR